MEKRLGSILLTLALLLALAPMLGGSMNAEGTTGTEATKVRIAGVADELTVGTRIPGKCIFWQEDGNSVPILEIVGDISGSMYQCTNTNGSKEYAAIWANGDLILRMSAEASVGGTPGSDATAVYGVCVNGKLTIQGSPIPSVVTVQAPGTDDATVTWNNSTGIYCTGELTVEQANNLTLNAYGGKAVSASMGIKADAGMTVAGGKLTAKGGPTTGNFNEDKFTYGSYGIRTKTLTVSAGSVEATGGANSATVYGYSCGILAFGDVNLTTTGSVTAKGGTATESRGIRIDGSSTSGGKLTSSCGSLTAEGGRGNGTNGASSIGIETYYNPVLNDFDEVPCEVTFTAGMVTVKGGAAESASYGIKMGKGILTVSGSAGVTASSAAGDRCSYSSGIVTATEQGEVRINTTGTVKATAGGGDLVRLSYGIESGKLTINGGTVEAAGGRCGSTGNTVSAGICLPLGTLESYHTYYQTGGTVTATGGTATGSNGVRVLNGTFSLEKGTLIAAGGTATGESGKSCGLYVRSQYVDLSGLTGGQKLEASGQTRAIEVFYENKVTNHNGGNEDWPWLSAPVILAGESSASKTLRPYGGQYIGGAHYSEASDHIYNCKYVLAGPSGTGGKTTSDVPKRDISGYTPTMQNRSFVYDGSEKTQPAPTKLVLGGVNIISSLTASGTTKATNAGTYTIYLKPTQQSSHYTGTAQAKWTIAQADNPIRGSSVSVAMGGSTFDLSTAVRNAQGTVTYAITSADALGCSVDRNTGAFTSGNTTGTVTVRVYATTNSYSNYKSGSADVTVTIKNKATVSITEGAALAKLLGDRDFTLHAAVTGASGGTWTWSSNDTSVAAVTSAGTVYIRKTGTAVITARYEDATHVGTASLTLTVGAMQKPTVTVSGTKLQWSATLPDSGESVTVIAAWYDGSGRMVGMASKTITASGAASGEFTVGTGSGCTYKLMIVDAASYAPLCEAAIAGKS